MSRLRIRHESVYAYDRPIRLGEWRLMMRPTDSHAVRVLDAGLALSPAGQTLWTSDVYGNSVCRYTPGAASDRLSVVSTLLIERFPAPLIARHSSPATIAYTPDERAALTPFMTPALPAARAHLDWLQGRLPYRDEQAIDYLQRINSDIHAAFTYGVREEEGTQSPEETIASGSGTCRDFAWLMIETVRRQGYAARFVSGYLYAPAAALRGAGATHAWCEIYLPDMGWLEFDPTNGLAESPDLIRVAATRLPSEASPMSGVVEGDAQAALTVNVAVTLEPEPAPFQ